MGITGLLPFLKKASRPTHISEFRDKTVAIDVYCWLHRGAFGCADKLVLGQKTDGYITYVMKYVDLLLYHNIKPIMVFDGRNLPSKAETEKKRRDNRNKHRKMAKDFLNEGKYKEARECFQRCIGNSFNFHSLHCSIASQTCPQKIMKMCLLRAT